MKTTLYKADSRGYANHGWLKSHHTFSFAGYHNPERMHFGALRVFNDDVVQPKMGFGTHPHDNMEIISIPLKGTLSHKDNMDNKRAITPQEVQAMSAGTGLTHSEFNDSANEAVNFFQLWIIPDSRNVSPRYEQKNFDEAQRNNKLQVLVESVASTDESTLKIHQDAKISRISLEEGQSIDYTLKSNDHGVFIMNISGTTQVADQALDERDAIGISEVDSLRILSTAAADILFVEVPM